MLRDRVIDRITNEFGQPSRTTLKVTAFEIGNEFGVVVQTDQPANGNKALVWLPYPPDGESIPEIALEYAGESGRHSNTYASSGLERGKPALKLFVTSDKELNGLIEFINAFKNSAPLPDIPSNPEISVSESPVGESRVPVDTNSMPKAEPIKPRREAIPRAVQREVWQRDGGLCVECGTRANLCFDHIVPFSLGGSNTVRNIQLLCESCNLSKGNRI